MLPSSKAKSKRENEILHDMTHTAGWGIIKSMAEDRDRSLTADALIPAKSEWEALAKESILRGVRELRLFISTIEERAERYLREREDRIEF